MLRIITRNDVRTLEISLAYFTKGTLMHISKRGIDLCREIDRVKDPSDALWRDGTRTYDLEALSALCRLASSRRRLAEILCNMPDHDGKTRAKADRVDVRIELLVATRLSTLRLDLQGGCRGTMTRLIVVDSHGISRMIHVDE